jgi:NAD(P)-dependent dehydrogenase (short-subunit alcohol dehydrogenase family)
MKRFNAGVHLKTAGTTWLEELIGLAEAGGDGLALAQEMYFQAFAHRDDLCSPYATVIDIDPAKLPSPNEAMTTIFSLEGKAAVVIGGTTGIGRVVSLGLADAGADVVASARRRQHIAGTAAAIEQRGRQTLRLCSDVRDRASLEQLLAASLHRFGKVDILINCAGKIKRMPTLTMPEEEWADIVDTNLTGTLRACQIFGRHMLERGYGRVINIASLNSFVALSEVAAYAASKAGVVSLTLSLAVEWSRRGVTVNLIAPGVFRTALNADLLDNTPRGQELLMRTPMGRFGKTEELVGAAVYLASEASSFVTGQTLVVDGGFLSSGVNQ